MATLFNETLDDVTADVRQREFRGGADTFTPPVDLPDNAAQILENAVVTDAGRVKTRPGSAPLGGGRISGNALVQALCWFSVPTLEGLIAAHLGQLWIWAADAWTAIAGYAFDADARLALASGGNVVYASDGENAWASTDGVTATVLGTATGATGDPPVGARVMVWHQRRMFAADGVALAISPR